MNNHESARVQRRAGIYHRKMLKVMSKLVQDTRQISEEVKGHANERSPRAQTGMVFCGNQQDTTE